MINSFHFVVFIKIEERASLAHNVSTIWKRCLTIISLEITGLALKTFTQSSRPSSFRLSDVVHLEMLHGNVKVLIAKQPLISVNKLFFPSLTPTLSLESAALSLSRTMCGWIEYKETIWIFYKEKLESDLSEPHFRAYFLLEVTIFLSCSHNSYCWWWSLPLVFNFSYNNEKNFSCLKLLSLR